MGLDEIELFTSRQTMLVIDYVKLFIRALAQFVPTFLRNWIWRVLIKFRGFLMNRMFGLKQRVDFLLHSTVDVDVVTIDGVNLRTTLYHPHVEDPRSKRPCVIFRTPYYRSFDKILALPLVERGYDVLCQDVRGRFDSTGHFTFGENEKKDAQCTLRWLAHQPWFDGRVALCGISIGGFSTWCTYAGALEMEKEPGNTTEINIIAVLPFASSSDIIRNGTMLADKRCNIDTPMKLDLVSKYANFMQQLQKPKPIFGSYLLYVVYKAVEMSWKFKSDSFRNAQLVLPLNKLDESVIGEKPLLERFWSTDLNHPKWKDIDQTWAVTHLGSNTQTALHVVSGWYDIFANETINDYLTARKASDHAKALGLIGNDNLFLTMGPWSHFDTYYFLCFREVIATLESQAGILTHAHADKLDPATPRVMLFCLNAGRNWRHKLGLIQGIRAEMDPSHSYNSPSSLNHPNWRFYNEFPPACMKEVKLGLSNDRKLVRTTLQNNSNNIKKIEAVETIRYDPMNPTPTVGGCLFDMIDAGPKNQYTLEYRRDDVIFFTSPEIKYAFEIAGMVKFSVRISSSADSCDVFAALCVVDEHRVGERDESINLVQGLRRVTPKLENNKKFPMDVEMEIGYICARFEKGQRIRLQIAGGSFPMYSRNLGRGEDTEQSVEYEIQENTIHLNHCNLILPVTLGDIRFV